MIPGWPPLNSKLCSLNSIFYLQKPQLKQNTRRKTTNSPITGHHPMTRHQNQQRITPNSTTHSTSPTDTPTPARQLPIRNPFTNPHLQQRRPNPPLKLRPHHHHLNRKHPSLPAQKLPDHLSNPSSRLRPTPHNPPPRKTPHSPIRHTPHPHRHNHTHPPLSNPNTPHPILNHIIPHRNQTDHHHKQSNKKLNKHPDPHPTKVINQGKNTPKLKKPPQTAKKIPKHLHNPNKLPTFATQNQKGRPQKASQPKPKTTATQKGQSKNKVP